MKTLMTFKSFRDLSPDLGIVQAASTLASSESSRPVPPESVREESREEGFRMLLHRRATAPFVSAIAWNRWGINE
jgi:hypothetical protein